MILCWVVLHTVLQASITTDKKGQKKDIKINCTNVSSCIFSFVSNDRSELYLTVHLMFYELCSEDKIVLMLIFASIPRKSHCIHEIPTNKVSKILLDK